VVAQGSVIALFPLHTVLFPGGPLPLRIFETRYTDMVRRCMREQQPFGVVLIQEGEEAGAVASTATVGCSARIADFYRLQDGLLGIACVGERKFRVERVWRASDGLNMGEVAWLEPEPELALPPRYARLGELLPIEPNDKQALLELDDPLARLDALLALAPGDGSSGSSGAGEGDS
jgi:Lon protease-like protein